MTVADAGSDAGPAKTDAGIADGGGGDGGLPDSGASSDSGLGADSGVAADSGNGTDGGNACTTPFRGDGVPRQVSQGTGLVDNMSLARAANGNALAVWTQRDGGSETNIYASEWDGTAWQAPIQIVSNTGFPSGGPVVAAVASQFVVGWTTIALDRHVAVWNGTGINAPTSLGAWTGTGTSFTWQLFLASTGSQYVATWDNSNVEYSTTSLDGVTWSNPQSADAGLPQSVFGMVSGPGGVLEWGMGPTTGAVARVWQNGLWSLPSPEVPVTGKPGGGFACRAAVANASAMLACADTSMNAELYSGGQWTSVPPTTGAVASLFMLASDGVDYRLDYPAPGIMSQVFEDGGWSSPVANPLVFAYPTAPQTDQSAGACGTWNLLYVNSSTQKLMVARAQGAGAYAAGSQIANVFPYRDATGWWPGEVDATWTSPDGLIVDLGF